jgi:hypothetical protein
MLRVNIRLVLGRRDHNGWAVGGCLTAVVGTGVLAGEYLLTPSVRTPFLRLVAALAVLGVLGIVSLFSAVLAWRPGARLLAVAAPLAVLVGAAAVWITDESHWRWSRDDFARVAAGAEVDCPPAQNCRLGWWRIADTSRYRNAVLVWLPEEDNCYYGAAYAWPIPNDPKPEALRRQLVAELSTPMLYVLPFRDRWYEVCIQS